MFGNQNSKAIFALSAALEKYVQVKRDELEWRKSQASIGKQIDQQTEKLAAASQDLEKAVNQNKE